MSSPAREGRLRAPARAGRRGQGGGGGGEEAGRGQEAGRGAGSRPAPLNPNAETGRGMGAGMRGAPFPLLSPLPPSSPPPTAVAGGGGLAGGVKRVACPHLLTSPDGCGRWGGEEVAVRRGQGSARPRAGEQVPDTRVFRAHAAARGAAGCPAPPPPEGAAAAAGGRPEPLRTGASCALSPACPTPCWPRRFRTGLPGP